MVTPCCSDIFTSCQEKGGGWFPGSLGGREPAPNIGCEGTHPYVLGYCFGTSIIVCVSVLTPLTLRSAPPRIVNMSAVLQLFIFTMTMEWAGTPPLGTSTPLAPLPPKKPVVSQSISVTWLSVLLTRQTWGWFFSALQLMASKCIWFLLGACALAQATARVAASADRIEVFTVLPPRSKF